METFLIFQPDIIESIDGDDDDCVLTLTNQKQKAEIPYCTRILMSCCLLLFFDWSLLISNLQFEEHNIFCEFEEH